MITLRSALVGVFVALAAFGVSAQRQNPAAPGGRQTFSHGGLTREYQLHAPASPAAPAPLIVVLHGGGNQDDPVAMIRELTRFESRTDKEGVYLLYPYAIGNYWNDGRRLERYRAQKENVDDVGFITALVDHVAERAPVDRSRVYATGASNGAMIAYRLGCERPDRFAAIAAVAGNLPTNLICRPGVSMPVLAINGTEDPLMPFGGGEVRFGLQRLGRVLSARDTIDRWATIANCRRPPVETALPDRTPRDGTSVFRLQYNGCEAGGDVVMYRVEGGGHTWPGAPQLTAQAVVGRTSRDIDATDIIWNFFTAHRSEGQAGARTQSSGRFGNPQRLDVRGYEGNVMEPAISRDGSTLVFNDMNGSSPDKNLFWARRASDTVFDFVGPVNGANTPVVDISPSLNLDGTLLFASLREYPKSPATLYQATWTNGALGSLRPLSGNLYRFEPRWASLDPDVTPDGQTLVFVQGEFGGSPPPRRMDIRLAQKSGDEYQLHPRTDELLARVNTTQHLEYAPAISADGLELFFTRGEKSASGQVVATRILRAARTSLAEPFGTPEVLEAISGFVEGPTLSADGATLYYHRKDGSRFFLYRVTRTAR